jgi:predicted nuclease of predicted toxin-antitoxin system
MLLFGHNLSPRLVRRLADTMPGATHVYLVGLDRASDSESWAYARDHGLAIVTKDADFDDLALLRGAPPKVIRILIGNCSTAQIEALLRGHATVIEEFIANPDAGSLFLLA